MTDELHETLRRIYIDAREGATTPEKAKAGLVAVYEAGVRAGSVLGDRDTLREKIARALALRQFWQHNPSHDVSPWDEAWRNDQMEAAAASLRESYESKCRPFADAVLDVLYGVDTERNES